MANLVLIFSLSSYLTENHSMIISIWNQKKIHKKHGGFLGCVKIMPNLLQSLKDAGCKFCDLNSLIILIITPWNNRFNALEHQENSRFSLERTRLDSILDIAILSLIEKIYYLFSSLYLIVQLFLSYVTHPIILEHSQFIIIFSMSW